MFKVEIICHLAKKKLYAYKTSNAGSYIELGELVYEPPRDGPTLWEIGIPDRSAAEFYVPDPNPRYVNKLFINHPDRLALLCIIRGIFL